MSNTYTIKFKNKSGRDCNYAFCTGKPIVNSEADNSIVMMNIWIDKRVPADSNFSIESTTRYHAWCGRAWQPPAPGVVIFEGYDISVNLGTNKNDGTTCKFVLREDSPTFAESSRNDAPAGCYRILTGNDQGDYENVLIGLGLTDNRGDVVPVATIRADRNMTVNIQPVTQFYVMEGNSRKGEIIDWNSFSRYAGCIDFSSGPGEGRSTAMVSHEEDGSYIVQYEG